MYQKITLKNGVRVVLVPRKESEAVTLMLGVGVGSRDEDEAVAGVSHFAEHMNFKGTPKRPSARQVSEFIEDRGGMVNAYTSKQHTAYYVKIASEHLIDGLDYLADNIQNPLNLKEEFDQEKNVILEDLKMHKDRPMEEAAEIYEEAIFNERSLARRVGGSVESVAKITHSDLLDFEKAHYHSANYILAIVGNFGALSEEILLSEIEKRFRADAGKIVARKPSGCVDRVTIACDRRNTEQTNLMIGFPAPGMDNKQKYAVKLLARILGGSMSSRMFSEVRERRGLAYAIDTSHSAYSEIGTIATYAGVANDKLPKAIEAIIEQYRLISQEKVSKAELLRALEITKGMIKISMEDSENVAEMIVSSELDQGEILTPEEILNNYLKVSREDILEAARKHLDFGRMVVSVVGPEAHEEKIIDYIKSE